MWVITRAWSSHPLADIIIRQHLLRDQWRGLSPMAHGDMDFLDTYVGFSHAPVTIKRVSTTDFHVSFNANNGFARMFELAIKFWLMGTLGPETPTRSYRRGPHDHGIVRISDPSEATLFWMAWQNNKVTEVLTQSQRLFVMMHAILRHNPHALAYDISMNQVIRHLRQQLDQHGIAYLG